MQNVTSSKFRNLSNVTQIPDHNRTNQIVIEVLLLVDSIGSVFCKLTNLSVERASSDTQFRGPVIF